MPLADYAERKYFKDVASGGKDVSWEAVIGKTSGKPSLLISLPIRANGAVVGVLAAGMTIEEVSKSVANWKAGQTGYAFLVDETSKVLAHPREDFVLTQKRLPEHPMIAAYHADHQPHLLSFSDDGHEMLGYVRGNDSGWAVVVQQGQDELFAPLRSTITIAVLLLIGAVLIVVILGIASSRMLVRPMVAMTAAADGMSLGDLDTPVISHGDDEISVLAQSLERLRKSLRAAMSRLR
jgi:methyl-accepting chemotaxis protein